MLRRTGLVTVAFMLLLCGSAHAATVTSWTRFYTGERPYNRAGAEVDVPAGGYTPQRFGDELWIGPLRLEAPRGQELHTGVYDPVTSTTERDDTHAAFYIDGALTKP